MEKDLFQCDECKQMVPDECPCLSRDEYRCENCKEVWGFFPEDYDSENGTYPTRCPLCSMPITQMVKDTFKEGGIREVLERVWLRFFGGKKESNLWN